LLAAVICVAFGAAGIGFRRSGAAATLSLLRNRFGAGRTPLDEDVLKRMEWAHGISGVLLIVMGGLILVLAIS